MVDDVARGLHCYHNKEHKVHYRNGFRKGLVALQNLILNSTCLYVLIVSRYNIILLRYNVISYDIDWCLAAYIIVLQIAKQ